MTIRYDEALRAQIGTHLAGHRRRVVDDPSKRHAAVAIVLVDSERGEDRIDPAPVDEWIGGRPLPDQNLDGRMVDVAERKLQDPQRTAQACHQLLPLRGAAAIGAPSGALANLFRSPSISTPRMPPDA